MPDQTYSESARGVMIGRHRIAVELAKHGHAKGSVEWVDVCQSLFKADDIPDGAWVDAGQVLEALGY